METPEHILDAIKEIVGPKGWTDDADKVEAHVTEQRGLWHGECDLIVSPADTSEVAAVMMLCHEAGIPVTPQGGNTGLVGGGVPDGGIVLTTARLNQIREVDAANNTMTVGAGCILANIQSAAEDVDRLFPLSLGAEGTCQIGGNLSTNAGGVQVLRYGNARDLVLGLEVVLPDGRVWDGLRGLRKDNTGYDLKHLFIGAEGTLGVITAAVLKLFPRLPRQETALAAMPSAEAALELLQRTSHDAGDALTGFELLSRMSVEIAFTHSPEVKDPFADPHQWYALVELSFPGSNDAAGDTLEGILGNALEDGIIDDAVIAASVAQADDFWRIREAVPLSQSSAGASIKHDVSVPVSKVPEFLTRATQAVEAEMPGIRPCAFGHLGDGNIHFNLSQPEGMDPDDYLAEWGRFNRLVHDIVYDLSGSFSAEHGIGTLKRGEMERYRPASELELMRAIKAAFDPKGIMNPGKVL
ncbi:MAG: FAD-binding oxidoreductase [Rhodospirillales bacterium]|nr:FAD-binding oxidoreductase [Alphaproteobacteria bacterium]MBL6947506.1 FAD-binding oxidoreductase [Rhodospirillales bacterium]